MTNFTAFPSSFQQSFGIRTAGLEEKATACQMLVCYARELKEGFAEYTEQVVKIMVTHLKFYFHDGELVVGIGSDPCFIAQTMTYGPTVVMTRVVGMLTLPSELWHELEISKVERSHLLKLILARTPICLAASDPVFKQSKRILAPRQRW